VAVGPLICFDVYIGLLQPHSDDMSRVVDQLLKLFATFIGLSRLSRSGIIWCINVFTSLLRLVIVSHLSPRGSGRFRPFAFDNNSIVIYLGLDSLFLFKLVSSFLPSCRSSLAHSFGSAPSFVLFPCFFIPWALVRRSLSTHYTPEALLNHVFEDLRKPKAPNMCGGPCGV
jgi:hypothetical protein